jgi:hypothetical protein
MRARVRHADAAHNRAHNWARTVHVRPHVRDEAGHGCWRELEAAQQAQTVQRGEQQALHLVVREGPGIEGPVTQQRVISLRRRVQRLQRRRVRGGGGVGRLVRRRGSGGAQRGGGGARRGAQPRRRGCCAVAVDCERARHEQRAAHGV